MDRSALAARARRGLRALWSHVFPAHFLRNARPTPSELGRAGERLVAQRLTRRGSRVLAKRLVTHAAEIDLLAEHADELWLVEVKTGRLARPRRPDGPPRWDPRGLPGRRLGPRQRARLASAARALLAASDRHRVARILLVEVLLDPRSRALECRIRPEAGLEVHKSPLRGRFKPG
ncbi:MAG: YraN family protein [Planctomycetes bacterium]|nr:YraN family protein [Planctomycetota bacterium]MCB9905264.1 YraN family protein [Planctomycetota bacterium]